MALDAYLEQWPCTVVGIAEIVSKLQKHLKCHSDHCAEIKCFLDDLSHVDQCANMFTQNDPIDIMGMLPFS